MIRINLLPVREIEAEFGRRQELIIAGACIGLTLVIIFGVYLFQSVRISRLEGELAGLRKELDALNVQAKNLTELQKKINELKDKHKVIEDLNKKKIGPVRVMESLSTATPVRLWINQFKETGGAVTIEGEAVDNQTISDFMRALSRSVHFNNVDLVETTQIEKEGIPLKKFSIKANLVYQPPPPSTEKAQALAPTKPGTTPATKGGTKG